MTMTFKVDNVKAVAPNIKPSLSSKKWHDHYMHQELARIGVRDVEWHAFNCSSETGFELIRPDVNSFLQTALRSYAEHVPLVLSPEDVWIPIIQAVAKYLERNPEDARKAIVSFEGQKELIVVANDFVKGSSENDWPRVFGQFGDQIETYLGKKRDLFDPTFSTTSPVEQAAMRAQMMAALAPYFKYTTQTMCGIPSITLLGEAADWDGLAQRATAFGEFYPKWAHDPLCFVTAEFARAAKGQADVKFWQNFVKHDDGSGGPYISGFINAFFPYLGVHENSMLKPRNGGSFLDAVLKQATHHGANEGSFPGSVTSVPMKWDYYATRYSMKLASGIFGITAHEGGYRPVIGTVIGAERPNANDVEANATRMKAYKELKVV